VGQTKKKKEKGSRGERSGGVLVQPKKGKGRQEKGRDGQRGWCVARGGKVKKKWKEKKKGRKSR